MWFNYWAITCLLSVVGYGLYAGWLRSRLDLLTAKWTLVGIVVLSLTLPFTFPHLPNYAEGLQPDKTFDYHTYNEWNVVDISDPALLSCYEKARTNREFCHCEIVQKSKVLVYTPNPYYNAVLQCKTVAGWIFIVGSVVALLHLLLNLAYLIYITQTAIKRKINQNGTSVYLLYTKTIMPIAAFSLWKHYIFWSNVLDSLPDEEQSAILNHELAHLRQRDTWQLILLQGVRAWWWTNPIFYFIKRELARLNEFVADEFAATLSPNRKTYARLLLRLKEQQTYTSRAPYTWSFAKSLLYQRITRIIAPTSSQLNYRWRFFYAICLIFALWCVGAWATPYLDAQSIAIEQYTILKKESEATGLRYFCINCIQKK